MNGMWLFLFFVNGLYREWYRESRFDEFVVIARAVGVGILVVFVLTSAQQLIDFAHSGDWRVLFTRTKFASLAAYGGCMLFFSTVSRFAIHSLLPLLFSRDIGVSKVLIIGANASGARLVKEIRAYARLGYRVAGFVDDDGRKRAPRSPATRSWAPIPTFPPLSKVKEFRRSCRARERLANEIMKILNYCGDSKVTVYMVPSLMDMISGHLKTHRVFGIPLIVLLPEQALPPGRRRSSG